MFIHVKILLYFQSPSSLAQILPKSANYNKQNVISYTYTHIRYITTHISHTHTYVNAMYCQDKKSQFQSALTAIFFSFG